MTTLYDAAYRILRSPNPKEELVLVDSYMTSFNKNPKRFVLPREHAYLLPIIEAFASTPHKFLGFVRDMRDDAIDARDIPKDVVMGLQEFSRTLVVRLIQRRQRSLEAAARAWFKQAYPHVDAPVRNRWLVRVKRTWSKQLKAAEQSYRKGAGVRHIPRDELDDLRASFWDGVMKSIEQGDLPPLE